MQVIYEAAWIKNTFITRLPASAIYTYLIDASNLRFDLTIDEKDIKSTELNWFSFSIFELDMLYDAFFSPRLLTIILSHFLDFRFHLDLGRPPFTVAQVLHLKLLI